VLKLAACFGAGSGEFAADMLCAQSRWAWQEPHLFHRTGVSLGHCASAPRDVSDAPLVRQHVDGSLLLVSGVPISLDGAAGAVLDAVSTNHAPELLTQLDGAFAAVYWDARSGHVTVVSDFLGLQPLYLARSGTRVLLASELKGIVAALGSAGMDAAGWGGFIAMGHCLADTTMLAGVRRFPAASIATWDSDGRAVAERQYWRWPEGGRAAAGTGDVVGALEREVRKYALYRSPGTVLLSGGFDSRLLLCILWRLGHRPRALSVRHPGERLDADGRFARAVADTLGVSCDSRAASAGFFESGEYLDYLALHEVANPTIGLFIAQVSPLIRAELGAVWEGVAPGYALAFPRIRTPNLALYLRQRCQGAASAVQAAARMVFCEADEMRREFDLLLAAEAKDCRDGDAGLLRFEVRHQMRHRMGHNPLKVYSNFVPCFTPGTSREFWSTAASVPYAAKWNFRFYFDVFRNHFPEALAVPFCSMGQLWSDRFRTDPLYYAARLFPPPGAQIAGGLLRRVGVGCGSPAIVGRVLGLIEPEHPDLRRDGVALLQRQVGGGEVSRQARRLLFHWQLWRWVLEGRLEAMRPAILGVAA
jgi:Glutamine amidotransferase domain